MLIAIYGSNLESGTVLVNGGAATLYYTSANQINALLPDTASGLTTITVQSSTGKNRVNVYVEAAAPAIFTQDSSGNGSSFGLEGHRSEPRYGR